MTKKLRIGVLGLTHDHIWSNLEELAASNLAELVCVADPHEPLLDRVRQAYACETYEDDTAMLDVEALDAVYVYGDNRGGAERAVTAAQRGLHVMIEKPMAADLAGAEAMRDAAQNAGTRLMVNWPFAWWPQLQKALAMVAEGRIGRLWQVRYRAAHAGPKELGCSEYFCDWLFDPTRNGGGAMMDYCCYGAVLAASLLGLPERVLGVKGSLVKDLPVEDNALVVMSYPQALAVAEASWTQVGKLTAYQVALYGTEGTLLVEPRLGGRLLLATEDDPPGSEVDVPQPPVEMRTASDHFASRVASGEEFFLLCRPDHCRDAQAILEQAVAGNDG